ncbi:MAG: ABC transporter ATP-binding protein/permease [Anaeroplasma bactoclasticum]|nr:ABC transporter ATP-binding protein/permease [Anaeroplasma bactoclasticum]MCM1557577.1 ABC transporter ATP-binding protein/permease [Anaeroplasma bactoclasticum]
MIKVIMKKFALSRNGAKGFIWAIAACVAQNLMVMFPVSLLYFLVNDFLNGEVPTIHYYLYGIGVLATLFLIFFISWWQYNATFFTTYKESGIRRVRLAEKLRKLPLSFFGKKDLSDLTNTVMGDCETTEHMMSHCVPQFWGSIISTCIIAISLFIFDWRMALAALWVLPVALLIVGISKKVQNHFDRLHNEANIAVEDGVQEALETIRDLKSNNAEKKYLKVLFEKIDKAERRHIKSELGIAMFVVPAQMILKLGIVTVALVGAILLINGTLSLITFFMFLLVVARIYEPMSGSLVNLASINSLQININRMNEIENTSELGGDMKFNPNGYDIEFKDVCFSYSKNSELVLNGVSFTAKQGEVTALIGESGGGKSTVAKLAARFWDAMSGSIKVGGVDVKKVDPELLLKAYSIVFQDVTLFNNTVMENIRIGKKDATEEEVLCVAKEARCDEFVKKLPQGYDTIIGENGSMLSGGERQRISIARAMLKDAPIVIMDEATASLDAENETEVQAALSALIKDKTVLIIAHRMRTVDGAEKIVVLQGGKVVEQGTPKELKAKDGIYARMVKLQGQNLLKPNH